MQNWSCMHPCGHSSIKFLWSCDTRAQDSFFLFKSTQCFQNMLFYQFMHSSEFILGVRENFHSIHPSTAYTFFQQNPLFWSVNLFSKKCWKLFLFKSVLAIQPKDVFFVLVCFCFFFFFFVFFRGQGSTFSSWVKVYDNLGFWLKACRTAGHDTCQDLANGSGIKGMSPHYSHDTHATNDD